MALIINCLSRLCRIDILSLTFHQLTISRVKRWVNTNPAWAPEFIGGFALNSILHLCLAATCLREDVRFAAKSLFGPIQRRSQ